MLLRRITEHVKAQNWVAVVLDFLIVVFGIFVGLQVDNWNEERKASAEEREYLLRLSEDAEGSLAQGRFVRDFIVRSADRAGIVLKTLDECLITAESRGDVANGLYHLGKLFPPYLQMGTIEELRSTGKLAILESTELRDQLNATIREFDTSFMIYNDAETRTREHVLYVDSKIVYRIDAPQVGNTEIPWEAIEFDIETICQDSRFYSAVASVRNYTYDIAARHDQMMLVVEQFKSVVDAELSRPANK